MCLLYRMQLYACTICSAIASVLYLGKRIWFWRCIKIYEQQDPTVQLENYEKKPEVIPLSYKTNSHREQFFIRCFCCKIEGVWRSGVGELSSSPHSCPVLLSAPDSWIYDWIPGQPHSMSDRWKHPSPDSCVALGSDVSQGKRGGSLGGSSRSFSCNSQLPF